MKTSAVFVAGLFLASNLLTNANAQRIKNIDDAMGNKSIAADTTKTGRWKVGGTFSINLAQQTASYWPGTSEAFSANLGAGVAMYANESFGRHTWDNAFKAAYAFAKTSSLGTRKTADFFDLFSKWGLQLNQTKKLYAAVIGNLRSQFSDGFDYSQDPKRRVSGLFAPANLLITPGLDWKPSKSFSLFASPLAARFVMVLNDPYSYSVPNGVLPDGTRQRPLAELYGVDPEDKIDGQFGAFVSANLQKDLFENVNYSSRLDLFSDYTNNPQNIDVFWTNTLGFKVNKWLVLTYQWNLAYDDQVVPDGKDGPRTQFLGNLGIGVSANF